MYWEFCKTTASYIDRRGRVYDKATKVLRGSVDQLCTEDLLNLRLGLDELSA